MNKRFLTILYRALALCFIGTEARGDAQSLFDRSEYQLGPMSEGRAHQFQFPLRNASAKPLSILSVVPTCVYLEAAVDRKEFQPAESVVVTVRIDADGNLGRMAKTIELFTTAASEPFILTIRGAIVHRDYDRDQPQAVFKGPCAKCHVGSGVGSKNGQQLYDAVCYPCHKDARLESRLDAAKFRRIVGSGLPGTSMPAFAESAGGPLSSSQIDSLTELVSRKERPADR